MKHLGDKMDIHCGGIDNMFPHHTNEIAQSESYLGHKWCNYWFHVHHLNDETGKMSKSKGEFLTVSLLESKGYDPIVYRMFALQSHYRKPLTFSYETLDQTAATYKKLKNRIASVKADDAVDEAAVKEWHDKFAEAVGNDCNTAMGITLLYDVLKSDLNGATKLKVIEDYDNVLSLDLLKEDVQAEVDDELTAFVEAKIEERAQAKKAKDFAKADAIRDELAAKGIIIKDTREGVVWSRE
jgi:cysteinyl-tRNA synthetase